MTLQYTYEKHFFSLLNKLHNETKSDNLCLGGGCRHTMEHLEKW